jgi:hypothetical protein
MHDGRYDYNDIHDDDDDDDDDDDFDFINKTR